MGTINPDHPCIAQAFERGLIAGAPARAPAAPKGKREKPVLLPSAFVPPNVWLVPLHVVAGDNARGMRAKIGRAGHERRVTSRVLGGAALKYLAVFADLAARGEPVRITLTRLGGRGLDPMDGLPASLKYVADTVALMMGFDDGATSPLKFVTQQEPGGPVGVRVTIEAAERENASLKESLEIRRDPFVVDEARWIEERDNGAVAFAQTVLGDVGRGVAGDGPCADALKLVRDLRAENERLREVALGAGRLDAGAEGRSEA